MNYSDEDLLNQIHRLASGEEPPTTTEMRTDGEISVQTFYDRYGSWNNALRAAGYHPSRIMDIDTERLLAEIHRLADGNNPPTYNEMRSDGVFSPDVYEQRFGTWNDALVAADYSPNRTINNDAEYLLAEIRRLADGDSPPTYEEMDSDGKFSARTYINRFRSWWRAVVSAGLQPIDRRPLTDTQFAQFFEATKIQQKPYYQLIGLLLQFTGLRDRLISFLSEDQVTEYATATVVTIPGSQTVSGEEWRFKLPEKWDNIRNTDIPGLLTWFLDKHNRIRVSESECQNIIHRVARDANIDREQVETDIGIAPNVRPADLRVTGGVRMARNGASARQIRRHLGIKHTSCRATVQDFFIWCDVHDDEFEHPDYKPPDVILSPV